MGGGNASESGLTSGLGARAVDSSSLSRGCSQLGNGGFDELNHFQLVFLKSCFLGFGAMEKFLVEYKSAVEKKLAEYKCNTNTAIELKLGMYAFPK